MRIFECYKLIKTGTYIKLVNGQDLYEGKKNQKEHNK